MRDGRLSGLLAYWTLEVDPLLTQAPTESFIKPHMTGGDYPSGLGVVDQVPVSVSGVADQNALEGSVCHLAALIGWDVNVCWAAKDSEMTQVRGVAIGQCNRDAIYSAVVNTVIEVAGCQHSELPVVQG